MVVKIKYCPNVFNYDKMLTMYAAHEIYMTCKNTKLQKKPFACYQVQLFMLTKKIFLGFN